MLLSIYIDNEVEKAMSQAGIGGSFGFLLSALKYTVMSVSDNWRKFCPFKLVWRRLGIGGIAGMASQAGRPRGRQANQARQAEKARQAG